MTDEQMRLIAQCQTANVSAIISLASAVVAIIQELPADRRDKATDTLNLFFEKFDAQTKLVNDLLKSMSA